MPGYAFTDDDLKDVDMPSALLGETAPTAEETVPEEVVEAPPLDAPAEPEQARPPAPAPAAEEPPATLGTTIPGVTLPDGTVVPQYDLERMVNFDRALAANPDAQKAVYEALDRALQTQAPAAPTITPPEGFDPDDPTAQYLLAQLQARDAALEEMRQQFAQISGQVNLQSEASVTSLVNRAKSSFQKEHGLSKDEMEQVFQDAERTINIPVLMSENGGDPLRAIEGGLWKAYISNDAFLEREMAKRLDDQKKATERKGKLSSLTAGGGSAPRQPEYSSDPREHATQLARELMAAPLDAQP